MAWASYGYFHLVNKKPSNDDLKRLKLDNKYKISLVDILDINYKDAKVVEPKKLGKETKEITIGTLGGNFAPNQAKRFFEKYDLLIHQPNTESGFSTNHIKLTPAQYKPALLLPKSSQNDKTIQKCK